MGVKSGCIWLELEYKSTTTNHQCCIPCNALPCAMKHLSSHRAHHIHLMLWQCIAVQCLFTANSVATS